MNITMISYHSCVRVQKMAFPLKDHGHKVHLITYSFPVFHEQYSTTVLVYDLGQLIESVKIYSPFTDVFHCHNEPSWFVTLVKENTDVPVVLDVHDSYLTRLTDEEVDEARKAGHKSFRITTEERNNFQLADGLCFPSFPFAEFIMNEFNLNQPSLVLPSYVYHKDFQYFGNEWVGGLVYQGRLNLKAEIEKNETLRGFHYCDYEQMATELSKADIAFHLYCVRADKEYADKFKNIAILHRSRHIDSLLPSLTRHDWGLVGNIFPTFQWDMALPNKLFEYLVASVPIVAMNAKESARFITEHGIGIKVNSVQELKERWSEHERCRSNIIKNRQKFSMDAHIHELEELYEKVINA